MASEQHQVRIDVGRVVERPASERHLPGTIQDVRSWLTGPARRVSDSLHLLDELAWRLVGAGIELARATFHMPTLHPQHFSNGYRWLRATGRCDETLIGHGVVASAMYRDSPMARVFERGEIIRRRIEAESTNWEFPLLKELHDQGLTDYIAFPVELSDGRRLGATFATGRPGGFRDEDIEELSRLIPLLAPLLEIQIMRRITANLLSAYLGPQTGQRVLDGDIVRGRGETIRAVIWLCDIRDFTGLSERLPGERVIAILNAHFEQVVGAIQRHRGEVLKFVGDGLLAIFPVPDAALAPDATARALDAARDAFAAVDGLAGAAVLGGEPPPRFSVALHLGEVIYGNIGAVDRLDFTVIGPAVNLVARLDQLSKTLGRRLLVTEDFAKACARPLLSLGSHGLRGMRQPREIFTLPDIAPARTG
jgi:adenylate cyclase